MPRDTPAAPARLDAEKNAKPKTRIVGHARAGDCQGPGVTAADTHVDDETGTRTSLASEPTCAHCTMPLLGEVVEGVGGKVFHRDCGACFGQVCSHGREAIASLRAQIESVLKTTEGDAHEQALRRMSIEVADPLGGVLRSVLALLDEARKERDTHRVDSERLQLVLRECIAWDDCDDGPEVFQLDLMDWGYEMLADDEPGATEAREHGTAIMAKARDLLREMQCAGTLRTFSREDVAAADEATKELARQRRAAMEAARAESENRPS